MARLTKKHVKGLGKQIKMAHKICFAKSANFNRNPPNREDRVPMQIQASRSIPNENETD